MKRKFISIFTLFLSVVFSALFLFACEKDKGTVKASVVESSDTVLVIRIDETDGKATLLDAMKYLQDEGEITFESQTSTYGEMLKSINGKANGANDNPCWLSYTNDTDEAFSNLAWGYEHNGTTFGSCNFGMSTMTVKAGCLYLWAYQGF